MKRHYESEYQIPPGPGSGLVNYEPIEKEMSHLPEWKDIPRDGGGDPDSVDY